MQANFSAHCNGKLAEVGSINGLSFRALELDRDIAQLQLWFNQDYAKFWAMAGLSDSEVATALTPTAHKFALIGELIEQQPYSTDVQLTDKLLSNTDDNARSSFKQHFRAPLFMVELYSPKYEEVGQHYSVEQGDCGMHLIIAPPIGAPIKGLSTRIMDAIAQLVLEKFAFNRLVVEPDKHNDKIHRLNRQIGITYAKTIHLSNKQAYLGFCTQAQRLSPVIDGNSANVDIHTDTSGHNPNSTQHNTSTASPLRGAPANGNSTPIGAL